MDPASPSTNTKKLYVGNFDESMNEYALLQLFKPFGKITFIEVMIHRIGPKKGLPRGFGFLEYEKKEQALEAINSLHRKMIKGKPLVVSFAHMTPEQEEAQKREQGLHKRPTTFSLLKGHKMKDSTTDAKIRAIERKLELLKKQSSPSPSSGSSSTNTSKGQKRYKPY